MKKLFLFSLMCCFVSIMVSCSSSEENEEAAIMAKLKAVEAIYDVNVILDFSNEGRLGVSMYTTPEHPDHTSYMQVSFATKYGNIVWSFMAVPCSTEVYQSIPYSQFEDYKLKIVKDPKNTYFLNGSKIGNISYTIVPPPFKPPGSGSGGSEIDTTGMYR